MNGLAQGVRRTVALGFEFLRGVRRFLLHDMWWFSERERVALRLLIKQARVGFLLFQNMREDKLLLRAAALTFATILSIVPFLALIIFIIQSFNLGEGVFEIIQAQLGSRSVVISTPAPGATSETGGEQVPAVQSETASAVEPNKAPSEQYYTVEVAALDEAHRGAAEDFRRVVEAATGRRAHLIVSHDTGQSIVCVGEFQEAAEADQLLGELRAHESFRNAVVRHVGVLQSDDANRQLIDAIVHFVTRGVAQESGVTQQGEALQDPVDTIVGLARQVTNPKAISIPMVLFVLATVLGLMSNIESSFNDIWGLTKRRSWYRRFSDYLVILIALPFFAAAVIGITVALENPHLIERLGIAAVAVRSLQYILIWLTFTALYYVVPNTRVQLKYALLGGLVAGAAWTLTSFAYVKFLIGLTRYSLIYSGFAQFPMLLMWIFAGWAILLFGAELTYAYQNEKTYAMERMAASASHAYREGIAIRLMIELAWRFDTGQNGLTAESVAESWRAPSRLLNEGFRMLERAGLVTELATIPPSYQPARSLDRITMREIWTAVREAGSDPSDLRKDAAFSKFLERIFHNDPEVMNETLEEAIRRSHPPMTGLRDDDTPGVVGPTRGDP